MATTLLNEKGDANDLCFPLILSSPLHKSGCVHGIRLSLFGALPAVAWRPLPMHRFGSRVIMRKLVWAGSHECWQRTTSFLSGAQFHHGFQRCALLDSKSVAARELNLMRRAWCSSWWMCRRNYPMNEPLRTFACVSTRARCLAIQPN